MLQKSFGLIIFCLLSLVNCPDTNTRFVLTGGPGVGKTTLIELLRQQGYVVCPETVTFLFKEAQKNNTHHDFFKDTQALQDKLLAKQLEHETIFNPLFLDRCAYDIIFYGKYFGIDQLPDFARLAPAYHIDMVFILDPLPDHLFENTAVRHENKNEAIKLHTYLSEQYAAIGIKIVIVPFATPEERVLYILETLKKNNFLLSAAQ